MNHIAIDLGGRNSQVCVRNGQGEVLREERIETRSLGRYLQRAERSRVVMETCAESLAVADAALLASHEVRVVPATLVRSLGVGSRRLKTDRRDAQVLSEVSCRIDLPSVHLRSEASRELQTRLGMRDRLVACRTMLINSVRGWLRTQLVRPHGSTCRTFSKRVRQAVDPMPGYVEVQLETIEALNGQIQKGSDNLKALAEENEVVQRLMSVPGVGVLTALRFFATVDQLDRFSYAHGLQSYVGLTPGEDSSSETQRRTSITKAGPGALRWMMVEAAWNAMTFRSHDPMVLWAKGIEKRRGKRIAVVALARKMVGILFAIWRDQTVYQPLRAAEAPLSGPK
ncbi:MAG: IS110 family transposase [Pseudomonadota bacterium]